MIRTRDAGFVRVSTRGYISKYLYILRLYTETRDGRLRRRDARIDCAGDHR